MSGTTGTTATPAQRAHVHSCMRCGVRFYCFSPDQCSAREATFPRVVMQGPDGLVMFEHVCEQRR